LNGGQLHCRQRNVEAERQACEIRLRAERRAGELLAESEKATGHRFGTGGSASSPPTLADQGISKRQSKDWQDLAKVPEDQFEAALAKVPAA
jgi:hypothetical protein